MSPMRSGQTWRTTTLILLTSMAVTSAFAACTDQTSRTEPNAQTIFPDDPTSGTFAPEEAQAALEDQGLPEADLTCAEQRLDPSAAIDQATADLLRQQCAAMRSFADSFADNLPDLTAEQRTCLVNEVMKLPPQTITDAYTSALQPNPADQDAPTDLRRAIDTCTGA